MQSTFNQPVFPNDVSYFFEITSLSAVVTGQTEGPLRAPHYQIVWITRGAGRFSIDLETYDLTDNTVYIIPPGRFYQLSPQNESIGHVLSFNPDFLSLAIEGPGRPFFKEISTDLLQVKQFQLRSESSALKQLRDDITREFDTHLMLRLEILSGLFRIFLIYMKRLGKTVRQEETSAPKMRLVNSFYAKLDKQFRTMKQVAYYASELSVSPSYLSDVVKKVTGYTASYHIQQRTVQEAKRLALFSDANMKTVAYSLGFDDLSHFSKFFKHATGINFSEFKKNTITRYVN